MRRSLVTGGAGFVGSTLVDALLERGDQVTVVDNFATGRRENLAPAIRAGAEVIQSDILDPVSLRGLALRVRPHTVFHLAAQIDVRRSTAEPGFDARVNIEGTINVLAAARAAGSQRFINSSTGGAIYGEAQLIPAPESHPALPKAPYGQSKLAAEGYSSLFTRLHGLSAVSLRYGNVYGPRQDPGGEAGVVAIFCNRILEARRPTVFGDGLQTRDYVHVDDVVRANLLAAESEAEGALNIGSGAETSVLELIEALREITKLPVLLRHMPERPGEVHRIALDSSRAREALGWEARISLREGLEQTLAWAAAADATREPSSRHP